MTLHATLRGPVLAYQRHRDRIEDAAVAAALALVVGLFLNGMAVYPAQWQSALLIGIFGLGVRSRAWGYYAAVAALLWPMWALSPYLMTLFLAVALLPREWIIEALPWALLIASAPLLAQWQMIGLVPLLAGVIAGPTTGLWAGILAALWLKMAGGLAGWMPEIGALYGAPFSLDLIRAQVAGSNSLDTLRMLVEPFAQSSFLLLLHALQIVLWGLAGWAVGKLREIEWRNGEPRFLLIPTLALGSLMLWATLFLLPAWLEVQPLATFLTSPLPTVGLALSALATAVGSALYEMVRRPVTQQPRRGFQVRMTREGPVTMSSEPQAAPTRRAPHVAPLGDDDVIMLELD